MRVLNPDRRHLNRPEGAGFTVSREIEGLRNLLIFRDFPLLTEKPDPSPAIEAQEQDQPAPAPKGVGPESLGHVPHGQMLDIGPETVDRRPREWMCKLA